MALQWLDFVIQTYVQVVQYTISQEMNETRYKNILSEKVSGI